MTPLYPLKFRPIFLEKIWGGQKIRTVLNKDFGSLSNCGESWELSGVKGTISEVADGELKGRKLDSLVADYRAALVGKDIYQQYGNEFPLLIKFIDAAEDLSIQVHPDDVMASELHNGKGKTEMWYILNADPDATLIAGFNRSLEKDTYLAYFNSGRLEEVLNKEKVSAGDVFYIPAGRIHTIGKGILLAEIQQTSDITYRIYDFDRKDAQGDLRELHTEQAQQALDYNHYNSYKTEYEERNNARNEVVREQYFSTNKILADTAITLSNVKDSFRIIIGIKGEGKIRWESGEVTFKTGDVFLIPAALQKITLVPNGPIEALEVMP
jgi:mannose-6-phosphate isomerase